jgi:hypothetical protein
VQKPQPAPKPAPAEHPAPVQPLPEAEYEPSTHVKPTMVEDVVADVDAAKPRSPSGDILDLSYNEMSRGEQINYEYSFARNVLQILTAAVPGGIGFSSLAIDSFQNVSAVGLAGSREQVTALFNNLRSNKFELLDPPQSSIRPAGKQGYRFSFTCRVSLGMNPADPWQLTDHVESRENLSSYTKTVARLAARNALFLRSNLVHLSSAKSGNYRRFTYHLSGSGSYRNFVKFVLDAYKERVPCAFSRIKLQARNDGQVEAAADIVFTARE